MRKEIDIKQGKRRERGRDTVEKKRERGKREKRA